MKWFYRTIIVVFLIWITFEISGFAEIFDEFSFRHELKDENFELIKSSPSPDGSKVYFQYMFDQGGYGYSRVFWSAVSMKDKDKNLEAGILPDGYRIIGWSNKNELIIESFEPSYYKEDSEVLTSGSIINNVHLVVK